MAFIVLHTHNTVTSCRFFKEPEGSKVLLCGSLEWVSLVRLLDGLQDPFVDPEADGDGQQGQADVGDHAHNAARHQGEEQQQRGAEHHACGLHITPVHEVHH